MDQSIFKMGLSVEGTSLYLLMVSLADGGAVLDRGLLERFWNASPTQLDEAVSELTRRRVIAQATAGDFMVRPTGEWLRG